MGLVGSKQFTGWTHKTLLIPKTQLFLGWNAVDTEKHTVTQG